jgi:hypothetical protein
MSYYFPFGGASSISIQNISYSFSATTASVPLSTSTYAITASYATTSGSVPPSGQNGTSKTLSECQALGTANPTLLVSGSTGLQGPTGSKGADNLTCPGGTIECPALHISLSANWNNGAGQNGVNYYVPSGSQYSIVCMEIPVGCSATSAPLAVCPPYLPIAFPTIL